MTGFRQVTLIFCFCLVLVRINAQVVDTVNTPLVGDSLPHKDSIHWEKSLLIGFTFTQVHLSNWSAGGLNTMAINCLIDANVHFHGVRSTWDNSIDVGNGFINQSRLPWWEKADDKIDVTSKYDIKLKKKSHWYLSELFEGKTQLMPGYDLINVPHASRKITSNFLSPGYFILGLGVDYKPHDHDDFSLLISPFTSKTTVVMSQDLADQGAFGVQKAETDTDGNPIAGTGKRRRSEIGSFMELKFKFTLMKNITVANRLELFSSYLNHPENIDVNWDVLINMRVNKFISATFNTVLLYDHDNNFAHSPDENGINQKFGPITQFKEVFSVGLNYKFGQ